MMRKPKDSRHPWDQHGDGLAGPSDAELDQAGIAEIVERLMDFDADQDSTP